jgi:ribosomal protein S27AE
MKSLFKHTDKLDEEMWNMAKDGEGFILTDDEAKEMALDILKELGYEVTLKEVKKEKICPVCGGTVVVARGINRDYWGAFSEIFRAECVGECKMHTGWYDTPEGAEYAWRKISE